MALHAEFDAAAAASTTGLLDGASDRFIRDARTTDVDAAWEAYTQTCIVAKVVSYMTSTEGSLHTRTEQEQLGGCGRVMR